MKSPTGSLIGSLFISLLCFPAGLVAVVYSALAMQAELEGDATRRAKSLAVANWLNAVAFGLALILFIGFVFIRWGPFMG